ncbi:MAG: SGNH/GDSL hydrolase family protein [Clostridia bacterium]|nr:SGNH/GDSL hydrolase family protein [Clostridia bacterium]
MKLTLEDVKKITSGALEITQNDGVFSFCRYEQGAKDYYENCGNNGFRLKSKASAGIRLDFMTNSDRFDTDFAVDYGSSRTYYYFDVCIDGIIRKHLGEEVAWIKKGHISLKVSDYIPVDGSEHRITLWLPNLASTKLSNIEIDDGATLNPINYKMKLLCFGDSITQGYDAEFPSKSYVNRLASHFDAYTVNQAIGGERFVPGILLDNTAYMPDVVTVAYGTNDWSGTTKEVFHPKCEAFFEKAGKIYADAKKFAILPIWRADAKSGKQKYEGSLDEACEFIAETASKNGFRIIDARPFLPQCSKFFWDGRLHPNDLGFSEYAGGLIAEMEKYI